MALFYTDSSALVKLVRDEPESPTLRTFVANASLVSCDLVLTEIPRAIRRSAALDPRLDLEVLLARAGEVIDAVALVPVDRTLLLAAGAFAEPSLRALDAIHVAAAVSLAPIDAFLGYDERQAAAARLAGLRTFAPGLPAADFMASPGQIRSRPVKGERKDQRWFPASTSGLVSRGRPRPSE